MSTEANLLRSISVFALLVGGPLAVLIPERAAIARPLTRLTYSELMKQADAVVVATALSTVEDRNQDLADELEWLNDHVERVVTTFRIDGIAKGRVEGDRASLIHYRFKPADNEAGRPPVANGPRLIRFDAHGPIIGKNLLTGNSIRGAVPTYLLFLKVTADGSFVPVTGQFDSDDSVRRLEAGDRDRQKVSEPHEPDTER